MNLIVGFQNLRVPQGDIGNSFIQSHIKEKKITKCGPEFGDRVRAISIIERAFYGLAISAELFRIMLADFLRTLDFAPSRFDRDVWMRLRDEKLGYDGICTRVDDFKIVPNDPNI